MPNRPDDLVVSVEPLNDGGARYEQRFFDNIVDSLRVRGMSKSDAEEIALERLIHLRDAKASPPQGGAT